MCAYIYTKLTVPSPLSPLLAPNAKKHSPDALARAALDLLMVLHARLDAAVHSPQPAQQQALLALAGLPLPADTPQPLVPLAPAEAWPLAWAAVLSALAAAAGDPRLAVRCHALTLLAEALLDQQSRRVGGPALARALGEIAVPLARLVVATPAAATRPYHPPFSLPQQQGGGPSAGSSSAAAASSSSSSPPRGRRAGSPTAASSSAAATPGAEKGGHTALRAKELALSLVCQTFLSHLRELLPLPHFHELWLQVSHVTEIRNPGCVCVCVCV